MKVCEERLKGRIRVLHVLTRCGESFDWIWGGIEGDSSEGVSSTTSLSFASGGSDVLLDASSFAMIAAAMGSAK